MTAEVIPFPRPLLDSGLTADDELFMFSNQNPPVAKINRRKDYIEFMEAELTDEDFIQFLKGILISEVYNDLHPELQTFVSYFYELPE